MQDGSGMHARNYTQLFSVFLNPGDGTQLNYRTTNGFDNFRVAQQSDSLSL